MRLLLSLLLLTLLYQCDSLPTKPKDLDYKHINYAPYHFQLLLDTNEQGDQIVPLIDITDATTTFSQRIHPTNVPIDEYIEGHIVDTTIIKFRDVNFDGYPDIMVLNWLSINHQKSYDYWLYQPAVDSFAQDTSLVKYWNPVFDKKYQTIISKSRIGCCDYENYLLKWSADTIFILEQEYISQDVVTPPHDFYYYQEVWIAAEKYIGEGILKMVSDSIFTDSMENTSLHFSKNISINLQLYWVEGNYELKKSK